MSSQRSNCCNIYFIGVTHPKFRNLSFSDAPYCISSWRNRLFSYQLDLLDVPISYLVFLPNPCQKENSNCLPKRSVKMTERMAERDNKKSAKYSRDAFTQVLSSSKVITSKKQTWFCCWETALCYVPKIYIKEIVYFFISSKEPACLWVGLINKMMESPYFLQSFITAVSSQQAFQEQCAFFSKKNRFNL